jgi:single-stranded-DNA-specific exonuclease
VNPNRQDEDRSLGHLCAAAVVFLMLVEANRQLRAEGVTGPNLLSMLDLVALATVADVAPLTGVNRAFVRQGLAVMARRERPGLVALADVARLTQAPTAHHLGYVLGPRVNAGGRIGRADLGARLLATADPAEAQAIAARLDALNAERREIEARVRDAALAQAEARGFDAPLVWAAGEGWHPGVVGIVAARLKEAANRPAVVIGFDGEAGKGSGRSAAGIDLGAAIQRLAAEGLIEKGGGHRMAAGLSSRAQLEPAMARLSELLGGRVRERPAPRPRARRAPDAGGGDDGAVRGARQRGAVRHGRPCPALRLSRLRDPPRPAGRRGTSEDRPVGRHGRQLEAIAFGAMEGPLGPAIETASGAGSTSPGGSRRTTGTGAGRSS